MKRSGVKTRGLGNIGYPGNLYIRIQRIIIIFFISLVASSCNERSKNKDYTIKELLAYQSQEFLANSEVNHYEDYPGDGPSICFMGDSRIDWFTVDDYWPNKKILNIARAGSTIDGVLWRLPQVREWKPDIIFISIGGNDAKSYTSNPQEFIVKYTIVLNEIRKIESKPKIFISNIVPVSNDFILAANLIPKYYSKRNSLTRYFNFLLQWNMRINAFNHVLRKFCEEQGDVTYVDLIEFEDGKGGLNPLYTSDGVHYNTLGYELFSQLLHEYF